MIPRLGKRLLLFPDIMPLYVLFQRAAQNFAVIMVSAINASKNVIRSMTVAIGLMKNTVTAQKD